MNIPTINFLKESEKYFSVKYPKSYVDFCVEYSTKDFAIDYPRIQHGEFICNLEMIIKINKKIGEEQWGDYEMAIAGKCHEKNGNRLWGDIIPIYFLNNGVVFGYNCHQPKHENILV